MKANCKYFPCHEGLEDCTFCYCPFYPCYDTNRGRFKGVVWSCKDCSWIHERKTVDNILTTGIIILAHGSRLKKANDTVLRIVRDVRNKGWYSVEPAYLQLNRPGLSRSVEKVVKKGCRRIVIVPFFLFNGNHVSRDIPSLLRQEQNKYKDVDFLYARNLGDDPVITSIVMNNIKEAVCR